MTATTTRGEPLRFLFDYLSPYAYLGWTQIHSLAERHGREVEPVPVLFAGLLGAHGQKGPAEIAAKRVYVFKNATRLAHRLGVPLTPPPTHPFKPLLALRASSLAMPRAEKRAFIDRLFAAAWGGANRDTGGGVESEAAVARCAREAGLDGDAILLEAATDAAKARLRAQTEDAIACGVFGVPTVLVGREPYWGCDSFPDVELALRGEDPVTDELLERWMHLRPSAERKF